MYLKHYFEKEYVFIESYYRQLSVDIKMRNNKIKSIPIQRIVIGFKVIQETILNDNLLKSLLKVSTCKVEHKSFK